MRSIEKQILVNRIDRQEKGIDISVRISMSKTELPPMVEVLVHS